ncbi:Hypothetical predicted protein [Podarcis lilfordi]|uniref:Uncharacterized protein n=1 Tax=Podarcis lilfordi TaxID=74358 RepID=A0AA35PUP6_9SAUR|nr:Hypothetical predicted protein [Podarcis lilfordi]
MAAAAAGALRVACARASGSTLFHSSIVRHDNQSVKKMLVLWKQPLSPFLLTGQRKLYTAPVRSVLRLRPLHLLVATGGGYAGYKQYENYKENQLRKSGLEPPPKIASDWELRPS